MSRRMLLEDNKFDDGIIVLCKDFSPNEQPFTLWENQMIDWDKYELYINVYINNYTKPTWGNVVSIGVNLEEWTTTNTGRWHIYYHGTNKQLRTQCVYSNPSTTIDVLLDNMTQVEVIINKDGLYLNGNMQQHNNQYVQQINDFFLTNPISIGSQEGAYKGVAFYNLVQLQPYQERGE